MKTCGSCGRQLACSEFGKNRSKPDGLQSWCRTCQRAACANTKATRMVWHECPWCGSERFIDSRQVTPDLVCANDQRLDLLQRTRAIQYLTKPIVAERAAWDRARKYSRNVVRDMNRVYKRVVRELQWIEVRKPRECQNCGDSFVTESWIKIYCSERCSQRAVNGNYRRKYGRFWVSDAQRITIYERDEWTCFCGDLVIPWGSSDDPYDPRYATLDHIQPRSLGGSDDDDNLRTAHFGCNSERGADPDWELERSVA